MFYQVTTELWIRLNFTWNKMSFEQNTVLQFCANNILWKTAGMLTDVPELCRCVR